MNEKKTESEEVTDLFGMITALGGIAMLVSPIRLSRRKRIVRWVRSRAGIKVRPVQPRGAMLIEKMADGVASILDSALGEREDVSPAREQES